MVVERHLLRDAVQSAVLDKLLRGDYPVGTRINEVHLAAELGVSRTPLREALSALANDGLIEARPSRGFWLSPLTDTEVRETYPIISALEQFALRRPTPPSSPRSHRAWVTKPAIFSVHRTPSWHRQRTTNGTTC